jgi:hypothetical protein
MLDRFAIETPGGLVPDPRTAPCTCVPEWRKAPPPARPLRVVDRAGVDRHPIDAGDPVDALRLMSYLWPDQPDRMAMTRGAIGMGPTRPDEGDAAPWLARRLADRGPGGSTWSTRPSPGNISPPKRSRLHPVAGDRGRARDVGQPARPCRLRGRRPPRRWRADCAALAPCAGARDPCARRFSRPLGRLARIAIALRRRLLAWFRVKCGCDQGDSRCHSRWIRPLTCWDRRCKAALAIR